MKVFVGDGAFDWQLILKWFRMCISVLYLTITLYACDYFKTKILKVKKSISIGNIKHPFLFLKIVNFPPKTSSTSGSLFETSLTTPNQKLLTTP